MGNSLPLLDFRPNVGYLNLELAENVVSRYSVLVLRFPHIVSGGVGAALYHARVGNVNVIQNCPE